MKNRIKYHARVDTALGTFHTRNVYDSDTGFTHIDIYDSDGKFMDEYASGFSLCDEDMKDDEEQYRADEARVIRYIEENLMH